MFLESDSRFHGAGHSAALTLPVVSCPKGLVPNCKIAQSQTPPALIDNEVLRDITETAGTVDVKGS